MEKKSNNTGRIQLSGFKNFDDSTMDVVNNMIGNFGKKYYSTHIIDSIIFLFVEKKWKVEINFKINHNALHIEIFNHGNWLDKSNNHTSHSINITKERIDILNLKRKDYIRLFIEKSPSVKILFKIQLIK